MNTDTMKHVRVYICTVYKYDVEDIGIRLLEQKLIVTRAEIFDDCACTGRESNPGLYRGRVLFYH